MFKNFRAIKGDIDESLSMILDNFVATTHEIDFATFVLEWLINRFGGNKIKELVNRRVK